MKYKHITIPLFILFTLLSTPLSAQVGQEWLNQQASIPIASPNVAALNKFVEFPVSHFNGQANVAFPLYEIKLKNITVPITLKYHTGGIRVSEEPSWVGLGWALDAGGVISHQVNGKDDVAYDNYYTAYGAYFHYQTKSENETYTEGVMPFIHSGGFLYDQNGQLKNNIWNFHVNYHKIDGEPDLYIYNMGNYSGKFISYDRTCTDFGCNIISYDLSCNNVLFKQYIGNTIKGDSIIATDPNGNIYKFTHIEKSISVTGIPNSINPTSISAYYLSEIISPNGERVKFHYKTFQQLIDENRWETEFPNYTHGGSSELSQNGYYPLAPRLFEECYFLSNNTKNERIRLLSNTYLDTWYLDKIEFPSGTIEFKKSPRKDAYGLKLDRIQVKNSNNIVKTIEFNYDYFDAGNTAIGGEVMTATGIQASYRINYPENYLKKRLKLLSFSEKSNNGSQSESRSFTYENERLPYKTSFAQDFWGYYNGRLNYTLLPSYKEHYQSFSIPYDFGEGNLASWATANRNVYPYYTKAGILTEITHPTSGKTVFEYEPNECVNSRISSQHLETRRINATDFNENIRYKYGSDIGRTEFELTKKTDVYISVTMGNTVKIPNMIPRSCFLGEPYYSGSGEDYIAKSGFFAVIEKYDSIAKRFIVFDCDLRWDASSVFKNGTWYENAADPAFEGNRELAPGRYRLTACFPDDRGKWSDNNPTGGSNGSVFVSLSLFYEELVPASTSKVTNITGGLRIKKVTQKDPVGNTTLEKQYTYKNGILATEPIFTHALRIPDNSNNNVEFTTKYALSPNPVHPYSFSANGSLVGYKNVTESYSGGEDIGRIEYTYQMEDDVSSTIIPTMSYAPTSRLTNGFLVSKYVYDKDGVAIFKNTYTRTFLNTKVFWAFKIDPVISHLPVGVPLTSYEAVLAGRIFVYFYPIIQGKVANATETEALYFGGEKGQIDNAPDIFTKTTGYTYDPLYGQVTQKSINGITETYKYASRATGEVYRLMREKNILNPLVETEIRKGDAVTRQVTGYYQPYPDIFVPQTLQLGTGTGSSTPEVETRVTFNNYDTQGNPVSITKDGTGTIITLWSYKGTYPVAEIRNASYGEVNTALGIVGLGSVDALSASSSPDKAKLDNLRSVPSLAKAYITTYKYTPLIGMVEATAPNGTTTYYRYDPFNRLRAVEDHEHNIIESYKYHYVNEE